MGFNRITRGKALVGSVAFEGGAQAVRTAVVPLAAATGAGAALAWRNPTGGSILIKDVAINVTAASGTATIDVGVAANGTTTNDTLIDGASTNATGVITTSGTNAKTNRVATASQYVTGSITGTIGSFAGVAYITYVPLS